MRKLRDPNGESRLDVWPQTLIDMDVTGKYYYVTTLGVVIDASARLGNHDVGGSPYPRSQKVLVTSRTQNQFKWTLV